MGNTCNTTSHQDEALIRKLVETELRFRQKQVLTDPKLIAFPLSTEEAAIVDKFGRRVKLAFVNWSGSHMCRHCVDGLQFKKLDDISHEIRNVFGFNGVRLTFSLQMYYENRIVQQKYLTANPELKGKRALDIFDIVINSLTRSGLMVILNNHISSSMWCCNQSDGEGLWWTQQFPQYKWIDALRHFSQRYAHNPRVIGFDLRNQIRDTPHYSATWGDGNVLTDWKKAAVEGANEILKINPNLLIIVSGLNFGLDLSSIKKSPIQDLMVPNKLVYTGHFYGFSWFVGSWRMWSYQQFKQKMFKEMTFVRAMGVPFWLGQFGTNTSDIPWNFLIQYLRQSDIDWAYWALDGFKCEPDDDQTYGIYCNDFSGARHPQLVRDLQSIMRSSFISLPRLQINNLDQFQ